MRNPAAVEVIRLFAAGARYSRSLGVHSRSAPMLPDLLWAAITCALPLDVCVQAVLVGMSVILAGLAAQLDEVPV
jgi:hypothetical protein